MRDAGARTGNSTCNRSETARRQASLRLMRPVAGGRGLRLVGAPALISLRPVEPTALDQPELGGPRRKHEGPPPSLGAVDRTRVHHEVAPWYLGDVPEGESRSCDALTQNIDWATGEPQPCSRPAHVMYGELALCWQHERSIVYHVPGDERTVPVGMSETRFSYGAITELDQWLHAMRARKGRAAEAADREAAESAQREAQERLHRAAARAARRRDARESRPNHLRSVE
jgi:hypothetical protein